MNKTRHAEASFDLYDDDNGPGSELPPQDRIGYVLAVTPSRRRSPAAVGKRSFALLSSYRTTLDVCGSRSETVGFQDA